MGEKTTKARQAAERAARWGWFQLYAAATLAGLVALAVAYQFVDPAPPSALRLATGGPSGAYFAYGKQYREILARYGIDVEVINTSGSIENLRLLRDSSEGVAVAFVQGGTSSDADTEDLASLASLYYEPAWLFYRNGVHFGTLGELAGRRVAVGADGSGTRALALTLLRENGLDGDRLTLSNLGGAAALAALQAGNIDAWFTVAGVRSALVRQALATEGIHTYSFARAEAYARRHRYLSALVLPEGTLDLAANIPPRDLQLVSPTAALVVRADLHSALEYLLIEAATEIHSGGGILEEPGAFPSARFTDLPLADAAARYFRSGPPFLRRVMPYWAANVIDRLAVMLLPLLAFALPLFRLVPVVYHWRSRSRIYRWYKELRPIETHVSQGLRDEEVDVVLTQLESIEQELAQLSVPWAYAEELYQLRLHIDLVRGEALRTRGRSGGDD